MKLLALVAITAGCTTTEAKAPPSTPATPAPAVDPWAPGPVIPLSPGSPAWKLTLQSHYGLCDPGDKRPCLRTWTATPDGTVKLVEHPNDGSPAVETVTTLSTDRRDRLVALVSSKAFVDGMAKGFPCSSRDREPDASLQLTYDPANARASSQFVLHCTRSLTLPGEVVDILR